MCHTQPERPTSRRLGRTPRSVKTVALLLALTWPEAALAQLRDHLECYKVKDPLVFAKKPNAIDLVGDEFGLDADCKIVGGFRLFCVPVTKTVRQLQSRIPPAPFAPTELLPVDGQELLDSRLCYKIKCSDPPPPDQTLSDQFGTRLVQKLTPFLLCTPAVQGEPCTPTTEVCNGADDDCDGEVDEEPSDGFTWFADGDGDGFGDPASTTVACVEPPGFTSEAGDCNDASPTVHPGAAETCNAIDDDCDGATDEGNPGGGAACTTGLPGICAAGTTSCAGGALLCQQNAPPATEQCNGIDDDCDGLIDENFNLATDPNNCGVCGRSCNDNNACTNDTCAAGTCAHAAAPPGTACSDGNGCTLNDACSSGVCVSGAPKSCNDANPCTNDTCTPATGACVFTNNTAVCSDGNPCTTGDLCFQGVCTGTPIPNCP